MANELPEIVHQWIPTVGELRSLMESLPARFDPPFYHLMRRRRVAHFLPNLADPTQLVHDGDTIQPEVIQFEARPWFDESGRKVMQWVYDGPVRMT